MEVLSHQSCRGALEQALHGDEFLPAHSQSALVPLPGALRS